MKLLIRIGFLFASTLLSSCASSAYIDSSAHTEITSLCELISNPEKHAGNRVHIRAKVKPSAHSVVSLYDDACKEAVVVLDLPNSLEGESKVEDMMSAVWAGYPAPRTSNVSIELYGFYRWKEREIPARYIIVEKIVDVAVK